MEKAYKYNIKLVKKSTFNLAIEKGFKSKLFIVSQTLIQQWLRDVYDIHAYVIPIGKIKPKYQGMIFGYSLVAIQNTWEEALELVLIEGLKAINVDDGRKETEIVSL